MPIEDAPFETRFFLKALVGASHRTGTPNLTEEDIDDIFAPFTVSILTRLEDMMYDVLPSFQGEVAVLGVKWGNDDDGIEAPPPSGPVEYRVLFPNWEIHKYPNQLRAIPLGPGSSGAGPAILWFKEAPDYLKEAIRNGNIPTQH